MEIVAILLTVTGALVLVLFLPLRGAGRYTPARPTGLFHEADSVLSRRLLKPGEDPYLEYYKKHPSYQEQDDRSRQAPGLLAKNSRYFDPGTFAASSASFHMIDKLKELTHEPAGKERVPTDPEKMTRFILQWMKNSGAHSAGITPLQDYHLYSHKGRGSRNGERIEKLHDTAVAITVEMDHGMMQAAPAGSVIMESSEQYLRSGTLAVKLAVFIRELGYPATAHIDGEYEVICPLVAADAGLGVIGRMGLLMTPRSGPRVRISVVTTSMPLIATYPESRPGGKIRSAAFASTTLHFCHLCRKCVDNCPAAAIPDGPRRMAEGAERWRIHSEKCYHYWTLAGTDCGRCISVCPFSHKASLFHRFIRWGIKNNLFFRYLAVNFDDVFYPRKPAAEPLPGWINILEDLK
jgi:ferredoxin